MKPRDYLETSIIGHLTARFSRDLLTAANQQVTQEWCHDHRQQYEVFVSQFVIDECNAGDPIAAKERADFVAGIQMLASNAEIDRLAAELMNQVPLPTKAAVDAQHIAVAAVHGLDYLLTWNCKHIANASLRSAIEDICHAAGYAPPIICTPQQLIWS